VSLIHPVNSAVISGISCHQCVGIVHWRQAFESFGQILRPDLASSTAFSRKPGQLWLFSRAPQEKPVNELSAKSRFHFSFLDLVHYNFSTILTITIAKVKLLRIFGQIDNHDKFYIFHWKIQYQSVYFMNWRLEPAPWS
jgi:hypothetical protein